MAKAVRPDDRAGIRGVGVPKAVVDLAASVKPYNPNSDPNQQTDYGPTTSSSPPDSPPPAAPNVDWASAFFSGLGLPGDVQARINQIFAQYNNDTNAASAAALAYIRGTPWYSQTYPGIQEAFSRGVVSNEADYRNLLNQQTQLYKQYLGRDITADEYAANLREGATLQTVGGRLQGAALAGTYGNDWRYLLGNFGDPGSGADAGDIKALGEEQAGLDSPLGLRVQRALRLAQQRYAGLFSGQLATPSVGNAFRRLADPSTQGASPDVAA